ncbi:MAG: NADH-quinone oxidoreductase subunit C, partial [Parvularculaceae bacterium]
MSEELNELGEHIAAAIDDDIRGWRVSFGELTIDAHAARIAHVLKFLRDDTLCRFVQLIDLCGVDYPDRSKRFDVVYHLLSLHNNSRVRVKIEVGEDETAPSVRDIYPCADWFEREAFDMYGLLFAGH